MQHKGDELVSTCFLDCIYILVHPLLLVCMYVKDILRVKAGRV